MCSSGRRIPSCGTIIVLQPSNGLHGIIFQISKVCGWSEKLSRMNGGDQGHSWGHCYVSKEPSWGLNSNSWNVPSWKWMLPIALW